MCLYILHPHVGGPPSSSSIRSASTTAFPSPLLYLAASPPLYVRTYRPSFTTNSPCALPLHLYVVLGRVLCTYEPSLLLVLLHWKGNKAGSYLLWYRAVLLLPLSGVVLCYAATKNPEHGKALALTPVFIYFLTLGRRGRYIHQTAALVRACVRASRPLSLSSFFLFFPSLPESFNSHKVITYVLYPGRFWSEYGRMILTFTRPSVKGLGSLLSHRVA